MAIEKFTTLATTTLNGAIDASQTTLVVASASKFPTSGNFSLMIGSEIMKVTGVSGTTFTVARGQEGTTGASHSNGDTVVGAITARTLTDIRGEFVGSGAAASFTQARVGRLYLPTDSGAILYDDGSAIKKFGRGIDRLYPPVPGDFSWTNQGSASLSTSLGFFSLSSPAHSGDSIAIQEKSIPATPFSVLANIEYVGDFANFIQAGLCLRESGTGKIRTFGFDMISTDGLVGANNFTNTTTFSAGVFSYKTRELLNGNQPTWFKIRLDGTNIEMSVGTRRNNVFLLESRAKNYFFTTAPDKIGMYVNVNNASVGVTLNVYSWEEGT